MPSKRRSRHSSATPTQEQEENNDYADDITIGSQSVISGLTADCTLSVASTLTHSTVKSRQRYQRGGTKYKMATIMDNDDDYDNDTYYNSRADESDHWTIFSRRSSAANNGDHDDDDDRSIFSRYIHYTTAAISSSDNTQMKNILTASILIIGFLFLHSTMQLHEQSNINNNYSGHNGESHFSLSKQEELISRNAHDLVHLPPNTVRGQRRQNGSANIPTTDDEKEGSRNLQWKFEPETVELREQHPLISRPNLDHIKFQSQLDTNNNVYAKPDNAISPLSICGRQAAIPREQDQEIMNKFQSNCKPVGPNDPILLIEGVVAFGRTGNNLIEFLHALEKAQNEGLTVGVLFNSWIVPVITSMWMSIQSNDMDGWRQHMERTFCIKMLSQDELPNYTNIIRMETRDLFMYKTRQSLPDYIEFQTYHIRNLLRNYNTGVGVDIRHREVKDMCTGIDAMFGPDKRSSQIYSVIHSRNLEGKAGHELLERVALNSGCDPEAALNMEPGYIKAILEPIGMLKYPIIFLTDHQRPEILRRLREDPDIGPMIQLVPDEASWVGGDITLGIMSNVFIGNPASTFSGFIAKSRLALGFDNTFMFRAQNESTGEWEEVCGKKCIFWKRILWNMA